jgi:cellulose biosynthesis protein BcsQ
MTAFHRLIQSSQNFKADIALIDVGPNLGAINRSALIASDQVCLPLAPDLFSIQGLKNLGPTLRDWRAVWSDLTKKAPQGLSMPKGTMNPVGYVVMQHGSLDNRPVKAYKRWMDRIPSTYKNSVLDEQDAAPPTITIDPRCLSLLKHYRSLMPMAMEARKPIFFLKSADGAIGAHIEAVRNCYEDFQDLAKKIADHAGIVFN